VTFVEQSGRALDTLRANAARLGTTDFEVVRADALYYVDRLAAGSFDIALADPPYGQGAAAHVVARFTQVAFADTLWIEHRSNEALPPAPGARTRRYGDTSLTSIPAGE
jgi:16S rRNA G966 N2-methylase RsmD